MNLDAYADPDSLPSGQPARVAKLLGMRDPDAIGEVPLAKCISEGFDARAVGALGDALGRKRVIGLIIAEATLRRDRKAGKPLSKAVSERLYEVGRVVDAVGVIYHGDLQGIGAFLDRPRREVAGAAPCSLAAMDAG